MADTTLPPNATALERAVAEACRPATELPVPLRALWNPDACPVQSLPWLAWSFGVETWSADWSEEQKRAAIRAALPIKQRRGTVGAVTRVLGALGFSARLQEWHQQLPLGAPYTYRLLIDVDQVGCSAQDLVELLKSVERTKNLRSHLDTVQLTVKSRAAITWATATSTGHEISVAYSAPRYSDGTPAVDLLIDAALHGESSTVSAIEALHELLHSGTIF